MYTGRQPEKSFFFEVLSDLNHLADESQMR